MAPISLKRGEIDDLAEELIPCIAGLQQGTENFKIALRFVLSNFRFHRFLDVNSFDVTRKLDGIREKFFVHCKERSANQLVNLKDKYLNQPFSSSLFEPQTETHYGVLSLLLNLSQSPVQNAEFSPKPKAITVEEEKIDWVKYLLDGEETPSLGVAICDEERAALEDEDDDLDFTDDDDNDDDDIEYPVAEGDPESQVVENQRSNIHFRDSGMFQGNQIRSSFTVS